MSTLQDAHTVVSGEVVQCRVHDDKAAALAKVLTDHAQPPPELIGKLPRITCRKCNDKDNREKVCSDHRKSRCTGLDGDQGCGQYITNAHIHIDYVGHAEATRILIEVDPLWSWEPAAWTADGRPATTLIPRPNRSSIAEMWGRLTVLGKTLPCVGTADASKDDVGKELIGDLLRNGAMRFGIGLQLWSKADRWDMAESVADPPTAAPAPGSLPVAPDWREKFMSAATDAGLTEHEVCVLADENRPALTLYDDTADEVGMLRRAFKAAFAAKRERDKAGGDGASSAAETSGQEQGAADPPSGAPAPTTTGSRS